MKGFISFILHVNNRINNEDFFIAQEFDPCFHKIIQDVFTALERMSDTSRAVSGVNLVV
uniref:Uncharacterized protein n=1 Tax=Lepeophtheirus salmonis TaxID=72036 RepID=A0A0K2V1T3_LEPSM